MTRTLIFLFIVFGLAQKTEAQETVNWMSLEEAEQNLAHEQKKIFVYMYTDWCGWCRRMERETFSDPTIISYLNKHYYAVKFDAERSDTLFFKGRNFVNQNPGKQRSYHELAQALQRGRMSFPSVVFLNEMMNGINVVPGFQTPAKFEPVLHYYATDAYKTIDWEHYNRTFDGSL